MSSLIHRYADTGNLYALPSNDNLKDGVTLLNRKVTNAYGIKLDYTHIFEKLEKYEAICEDPDDLCKILDSYASLISDLDHNEWIDAYEYLPTEDGEYPVVVHDCIYTDTTSSDYNSADNCFVTNMYYDAANKIWIGRDCSYNSDLRQIDKENTAFITHWMHLPNLPKE